MAKRALISVYNKDGIVEFAQSLVELGWEIVSTGGTAKVLQENGITIIPIEKVTGNPEAFSGRMKTISFQIESAILFNRSNPEHVRQAKELGITPIDLVVCNLYPFGEVIKKQDCSLQEAIENIDIGGPTMIRGAGKNLIVVACDPKDYPMILKELEETGDVCQKTREMLAAKVFWMTADYDSKIDVYLSEKLAGDMVIRMMFGGGEKLRYGENPHQKACFYLDPDSNDPLAIHKFEKLQGKELSFNNFLDIDAVLFAISHFGGEKPVCAIVKHGNPCGLAIRETAFEAYRAAWYDGDPLAAFGGVMAINRIVDESLAREMLAENKFFEILLAPEVTIEALELFQTKKSLRILVNPSLEKPVLPTGFDFKKVRGGILIQDMDTHEVIAEDLLIATQCPPAMEQINDLLFAWKLAKVSKSNTIVIAKDLTLIASGVGQKDRKKCCELCVSMAGERIKGAVAASDGFCPFPDAPKVLIDAGILAIIQPGGSIRDQETIDLCNERGIPMVFTSKDPKNNMIRGFRH